MLFIHTDWAEADEWAARAARMTRQLVAVRRELAPPPLGPAPPASAAAAPQAVRATVDAREAAAYNRRGESLWKLFLTMGVAGTQWHACHELGPALRPQYEAMFRERMGLSS